MGAPPPPHHMNDYPSAFDVWQSPEQCPSMPWFHNATSGMVPGAGMGSGMGSGMRVASDIQNGVHSQDSSMATGISSVQYEGQSTDESQIKKSTIEYRTNDSGHYLNLKKEPDSDIPEGVDKVLSVDISNPSSVPAITNSDSNLAETATNGSMNPPTITPTKLQFPFSPPLPSHLQQHYGASQSTLLRAESLPQIPQTFAAPSSMDNYPGLHGNRGDIDHSFAPPLVPLRPLRQVMSAINLTTLNPTRDVYEGPVLPKRAPMSSFAPPPPKRPNTLQRCYSQPNITTTQSHQMLDHIMSIVAEDDQELLEAEPGDADMFESSSNIMSPHVPWGCYPEPGQLSQINAMSMPVLNDSDRYQRYNYLSSSQHMQHSMRTSEPYLNQLPLQSAGYIPHLPAIDRPPAHVAKPPEILEAQGQESDQSSECSIFQYENRLNSTGAAEQRRSDGSENICRGGLHSFHQTGSLPNISEMSSHCIFPRLDADEPCDNVFGSPLSGRNLSTMPYFEFGPRDGVKSSSSSTQVSGCYSNIMFIMLLGGQERPRSAKTVTKGEETAGRTSSKRFDSKKQEETI